MVVKRELAEERTVQLSALNARYLEAGTGEPTIFLHPVGFTGAAEVWLPCLKAGLAQKLRVIAPDMLGWGPGERPLINYSFAYWVDHVRELQDALGLKKTNIVGHSLGGWIGACLAYESPNRVNKLVLVANAGLNPDPPASLSDTKAPTKDEVRAGLRLEDPELLDIMTEERWRNVSAPNALESFAKINENLHDYDMRRHYFLKRRLPLIEAPTLIIYGENDPGYPPDPMGKEIESLIPNSRLEILKDTGHMSPLQRPKELTKLIEDFLIS